MNPGRLSRLTDNWRARLALPLLAKELTETAARRRTYVLRVAYALALYGMFALLLPQGTWSGMNRSYGMLGTGGQMFRELIGIQFLGVALFLPALMCGRITQEKERDSLVLLFLTELRPWSIILQKYLGGLILMLSFFLLGLPLGGVAYAFGGLESTEVARSLLGLLLTCLQIGALSILCSSWCKSTVGAFLSTYLSGILLYAGPPFSIFVLQQFMPHIWNGSYIERYAFLLIPGMAMGQRMFGGSPHWALAAIPSVFSIFLFLALARVSLVRRALVPPSNFFRRLFEWIDHRMKRLNRVTGGIVLWHGAADLPAEEPVFWRETHRRVLGKPHYLIRVLYTVEIPILLVILFISYAAPEYGGRYTSLAVLVGLLTVLATLIVSVHAANSVVSERVGQTLEVLLTTPLSAREVIRQKERAMWRLLLVIAIPLLTVFAWEAGLENDTVHKPGQWVPYLTCATLLVVIYLPMITWLSLWISLRVRTRFHAIVCAVGVLTAWAALAPLLFYLVVDFDSGLANSDWAWVVLLSPASAGFMNEVGELKSFFGGAWVPIFINTVLYATLALFIRGRLFADADRLLRR